MKISAVIPVFNTDPKLIRECVESVLRQTYRVDEIVLIDDASTRSGTISTLYDYGWNDKIILKQHIKNKGIPGALNTGIKNMTGDWFAGCSSDDRWLPHKIEEHIEFIESNPKAKVMYSDWEFIDHGGFAIKTRREPEFEDRVSAGKHMIREHVGMWSGMMIHKSVFDDVGLYNEEFKIREDYEMHVRILTKYMMYHIPKVLAQYRLHSEQITTSKNFGTRSDDSRRFCEMARDLAIKHFGNEEDRKEFPIGREYRWGR